MVERCINKKQYQQALTFMESAFPEYYKKNNIISFSEDVEKSTEKFNKFFKNHVHLEDKNKSPKEIIDNFCLKVREGKKETEIIKDDIGWKKDLEKELEKQLEYMKKQDNNSDSKLIIGSAYDFSKDILPVFKMHKTLKEIRNVFSHGKGGNRPDINYLDEYMRYYLKALKDLTQKQNSKDFNDKESCR